MDNFTFTDKSRTVQYVCTDLEPDNKWDSKIRLE